MDRKILLEHCLSMLSGKRLDHSLRCADYSEDLACFYGVDPEKAWTAGLTHDISRGQNHETIRKWAEKDQGDRLDNYEKENPILLHGYASAWYLREALHIDDTSILDAVRFHTAGAPGMDDLAKVVFAADYLEPGRMHLSQAQRDKMRSLSLDELILAILDSTKLYLEQNGQSFSPKSRELYKSLTAK